MKPGAAVREPPAKSIPREEFPQSDPAKDAAVFRLTRAIAGGDAEAFGAFYEAWFDRAYALARSLTRRDESFCLDVIQDTILAPSVLDTPVGEPSPGGDG